ncbi:protein NKG7-like [Varanus komodoensis]|uniref:Natural killer cell granule protein 7 n=1 Tax=Varanus komodoensis TaxID=61221 RepID=A0A8D2JHG3_VARKO|nr:protein NKG7-like [Varanus komodoensis]XP_044274737.1 protein NKG7-like [Varanus komodoensis]
MLLCRVFSMVVLPISLVLLVTALVTNHWLVAYGIKSSMYSGLWQECRDGQCTAPATPFEYIIATRAFLILASLLALGSALFPFFSFIPAPCGNRRAALYSAVASLTAGLFTLIAVAVYTAETWSKPTDPQVYIKYEWSFYLGWAAFPMLLLPGISSLITYSYSSDSAYEQL